MLIENLNSYSQFNLLLSHAVLANFDALLLRSFGYEILQFDLFANVFITYQ